MTKPSSAQPPSAQPVSEPNPSSENLTGAFTKVKTEVKPSVCPLDCPDTCSLSVTVTTTVEGEQVTQVRGSQVNPFTAGAVCNKVARSYPAFVHGEGRLLLPLRRVGPRGSAAFEPITWEAALDLVHAGFSRAIARAGGQSILPLNYAGPHGELAGGSLDRRFFYRLGATRLDRGPLCGGVAGLAYQSLFGPAPGLAPDQAEHADLIMVWGNNVTVSNLHFMRMINRARKRGARLVVVDPKRIKVAQQADLFLQVKPGTDVVLALALAAEIDRRGGVDQGFVAQWVQGAEAYLEAARAYTLEQAAAICGLEAADLSQLVDWMLAAKAMASSTGIGIERGRSGGSAIRAALSLHALLGQHGRPGAGVIGKTGFAVPKTRARLQGDHLIDPDTRVVNIVDAARLMLDRSAELPVHAVMIYNHNPVATHPDQRAMIDALSQEEIFTVGCDVVMTDSMAYCDVILPAASHFEHDDIFAAYGQNYVQRAEAVIPPQGDSLPNTEIFRRLAARFGFTEAAHQASDRALMDQAMDGAHPQFQGRAPSQIPLDQALPMAGEGGAPLILCHNVQPQTASGKIELFSADLEAQYGFGLPRFDPVAKDRAFTLITPSSERRINATFGHTALSDGPEPVEIHPEDAQAQGVAEGDLVQLVNDLAAASFVVKLSGAMQRGVLYAAKGAWRRSSRTGFTANALIAADRRSDIGDGASYNETFVDLERLA